MKTFLKPITVASLLMAITLLLFSRNNPISWAAPVAQGSCENITDANSAIDNDTTWGPSEGCPTVTISANVEVRNNATLTIEAGTTIKFNPNIKFVVGLDNPDDPSGTLIARGEPNKPIIFTTNQAQPTPKDYWDQITFDQSSTDASFDNSGNYTVGSIIQYAIIEYAGQGDSNECENSSVGALCIDTSSPYIDHSTIRYNSTVGIRIIRGSKSRVTNNLITHNKGSDGGGIASLFSSPIIRGNIMSHNSGRDGGGVYNNNNSSPPTIVANTVFSNSASRRGGGVYSTASTSNDSNEARIHSNNIISNTASSESEGEGEGGGIDSNSVVKISGNIIKWNRANQVGAMDINTSRFSVIGNIVTKNTSSGVREADAGIYLTSQEGIINYNDLYSNTVVQDGNTTFLDLSYNGERDLPDQNSENNWWGTTAPNIIAKRILDGNDPGSTDGRVDYTPPHPSPIATQATIGSSGGNFTSGSGNETVQVTFLPKAVEWNTLVTFFDIMTPTEALPEGISWVDAFIVTSFAEEEPYTPTMDFEQSPVTLVINYTEAGISNENNLNVAYWDPFSNGWKTLPCNGCRDTQNNRVTVQTNQFSEFALIEGNITPTAVTMQQIDSQSDSRTWLVAWLLFAAVGLGGLARKVHSRKS